MLLPALGGFQFGRKPNVLPAVGELFVRARSAGVRLEVPVLLPSVGGFQLGRRPNVFSGREAPVVRRFCVIPRRRRVSVRSKAERSAPRRRGLCPGAKRLCYYAGFNSGEGWMLCSPTASSLSGREAPVVRHEAPVLLSAVGGFQFGWRPNVLLAVGELFVRARSACVIARRRRVSIRPKRLCYCPPWPAKAGFHSAEGWMFCSP